MRLIALSCMAACVVWAVGCTAPEQPVGPTLARVQAETPEAYDQLFETVGNALREHNFRLDRQDRISGVVSTFPETSASWFEFWRVQPQSSYYWAEANTKTMRVQATVNIRPAEGVGAYDLDVLVNHYQYSLPERQIDNSAAAMRLFSSAAPTYEGRMEDPSKSAHWILLGRDEPMEQAVLAQIIRHYGGTVVTGTQPAEFGVQSNASARANGRSPLQTP